MRIPNFLISFNFLTMSPFPKSTLKKCKRKKKNSGRSVRMGAYSKNIKDHVARQFATKGK